MFTQDVTRLSEEDSHNPSVQKLPCEEYCAKCTRQPQGPTTTKINPLCVNGSACSRFSYEGFHQACLAVCTFQFEIDGLINELLADLLKPALSGMLSECDTCEAFDIFAVIRQ